MDIYFFYFFSATKMELIVVFLGSTKYDENILGKGFPRLIHYINFSAGFWDEKYSLSRMLNGNLSEGGYRVLVISFWCSDDFSKLFVKIQSQKRSGHLHRFSFSPLNWRPHTFYVNPPVLCYIAEGYKYHFHNIELLIYRKLTISQY